ncbi:hypothetical protein BJH93_04050 [Kocuria polaris]|nr:hypothetical protein [Kocuria polaris]
MTGTGDVFEMIWPITGPGAATQPSDQAVAGLRALAMREFVVALHDTGLVAEGNPTTDVVPTADCPRATGQPGFRRSPFTLRMRAPARPRPAPQ